MSENMKKFTCDPPPLYDTVEDAEKGNVDPFTGKKSPDFLASGDPPPYKQEEFPSKSISSFNHLPPLIMRPWQSFFRTCLKCHWSVSADNFLYNLNYYQINYAWIMVIFVIIALVEWVWFIYRVLLSSLHPSFWIHSLICFFSPLKHGLACMAGVIGEREGEQGRRENMKGIGERGQGTPATRTPFASFLRSLANANFWLANFWL